MSEQIIVTVARTAEELSGLPEGTRIATNNNRIMERDDAWGKDYWIEPGSVGPFFAPLDEWFPAFIIPPVVEERPELERTIRGLLAAGLLSVGDTVVSTWPSRPASATVGDGGTLIVHGQGYETPSRAALAALDRETGVNGWTFWAVKDGPTLDYLRDKLP